MTLSDFQLNNSFKVKLLDFSDGRRLGVRVVVSMALIAIIAPALRIPVWLDAIGPEGPAWWHDYWWGRQARARLDSPVTIHVTSQARLEPVLTQIRAATTDKLFRNGLPIGVDPGGPGEAVKTLHSPIGIDLEVKEMPARAFLESILPPMGLACKIQYGACLVTSRRSLGEPISFGDHGEMFCGRALLGIEVALSFATPLAIVPTIQ
ncbi:hypothetical protein ACYOEI_03550 [Singulisphaera rosea]